MGELDNVLSLSCDPGGLSCSSDDPLHASGMKFALFGEDYRRPPDGHIRRAVEIAYCRQMTTTSDPSNSQDFAYCILTEEPQVQAIPIMMPCEVEQHLSPGTEVVAVGFGQSVGGRGATPQTQGIKRIARAETINPVFASSPVVHVLSSGWSPGRPAPGDSGGPGFVQLPDGTWRQFGVIVTDQVSFTTVWTKVQWMLEDPNVEEDAILPCHNASDQWCPKPNCDHLPLSPDVGAGTWARGPVSCESTHLGGGSPTCSSTCMEPDEAPADPWATPSPPGDSRPKNEERTGQHSSPTETGCSVNGDTRAPLGLSLLCLIAARRRS
jgi:hypothetical protein